MVRLKLCVCVAAAFACFAWVGSAEAFKWHLKYSQAKNESKLFVEQACGEDSECTGYAVGPCRRMSDSRIDCLVGMAYADKPKSGEEALCTIVLHWGVDEHGFVVLKNIGRPRCSLA